MGKKNRKTQVAKIDKNEESLNKKFIIISIIALILSAIFSYSNSFDNSFQYDDVHYIFQSEQNKNLDSYKDPDLWFSFIQRAPARFTFALNYHFGEYSVRGYHAVNLLIHITASLLVFLFAGLLLNSPSINEECVRSNKKYIQLFAAIIFAVHPIQTEAVTYIVQRMESLSFVFYISSLMFYFMFRNENDSGKKSVKFFVFVLFGLLSVMTKQTAYTLPLTILLTEIYFIRDVKGESNRKLIYILTVILSSALIIGLSADILPREYMSEIGRFQYMLSQFTVIPKYIFLLFIPAGQNIDHNIIVPSGFFEPGVIAGIFIISALIWSAFMLYKKGHILLSFSIAWFFAVISLRSSVLPISDLMSEHRLYPAMLGYGIFITVFFAFLNSKISNFTQNKNIIPALLVLISLIYAAATFERNKVWKDELSLWKDSLSKSPEKFRPNYNTAEAYKKAGYASAALELYLKAYAINPNSYGVCNNIGNIYSTGKNYENAEKFYIKALELNPEYPKALNNLANVYFKKIKYKEAEELYIKASEIDPEFIDPILNLGHLYFISEHYDMAVNRYKRVLELNPNHVQAKNNVGIIESRLKAGLND